LKRLLLQFFYLLYCVESGIFLLLAPWSLLWVHGYFAQMPAFRGLLLSGYVRGGVSAIGLLMLVVATIDFSAFCRTLKDS
jgi:hypothetical protein